MHMVVWTIIPNQGKSRDDLLYAVNNDAPQYESVSGLIRMYYGIATDLKSVIEVYLWKSKEHADKFFNGHWDVAASRRWEVAPMSRQDFEVPVIVEHKDC